MAEEPDRHPGITMHRMPIAGGIMGAVFMIGSALIFLVGIPLARWFLLFSVLLGAAISAGLFYWRKRKPVELIDIQEKPDANARPSDPRLS